jgi:hypothetical protein
MCCNEQTRAGRGAILGHRRLTRTTTMNAAAEHQALVVSYLLALAGIPYPVKPILLQPPRAS